jgi:hypothetical protein
MKNTIVALSSVCLFAGCGMGTEQDAQSNSNQNELQQSPLARHTTLDARAELTDARDAMRWSQLHPLSGSVREDFCEVELVRPTAMGTIQSIPRLGVFDVAPVGSEVQSSYFKSNSVNEEFRRGIAEFYVPGEITSAVLQFREHRGWTSYPLPADTHNIEVYPANLELTPEDFNTRAILAGTFVSDPNLEPSFSNAYDLTKAVQEIGAGKLGVRFSIEGGVGSGTSFMDLALEVSRCHTITHAGD